MPDPRELYVLWQKYEFCCNRLTTEETCKTPDENLIAEARRRCWSALHEFINKANP